MTCFRIAKTEFRPSLLTGDGAFRFGGRWNSRGRAAVYASGNHSLAMLELLLHVDDAERFWNTPHVYVEIRFATDTVVALSETDLPKGWNERPATRVSQTIGDEWLDSQVSPVLAVPSVITPPELRYQPEYLNFLMNPLHPRFGPDLDCGPPHDLAWLNRRLDA